MMTFLRISYVIVPFLSTLQASAATDMHHCLFCVINGTSVVLLIYTAIKMKSLFNLALDISSAIFYTN